MFSAEQLARLSRLNREPLPQTPTLRVAKKPTSEQQGKKVAINNEFARPGEVTLEALVPGDVIETYRGPCFRVRTPLAALWPRGETLLAERIAVAFNADNSPRDRGAAELAMLATGIPRDAIFLDLETCGFAGSMTFLVGVLYSSEVGVVLDQLLARDYAEEAAVLAELWRICAGRRVLATFNGKSFDWPMVHDRSTVHRLGKPPLAYSANPLEGRQILPDQSQCDGDFVELGPRDERPALVHCDLLYQSRRKWKQHLPNCKLQTLERYICRRVRGPDIPGAEIPLAYHAFVRTGDARRLKIILQHNTLDLATLLDLSLRLTRDAGSVAASASMT